ncbi:MAG: hypothetical protein K6A82_08250 [Prevotella sp.]|nr:hypothetical protein [Prevotella sp.]
MDETVIGLAAVILSLSCGLLAIGGLVIVFYSRNKNERMVKQAIVENHVDAETARLLVTRFEDEQWKSDPYKNLRAACALLGMGVGYALTWLLHLQPHDGVGFWIVIAVGLGLGLLISFFMETYLDRKKAEKKVDADGPQPMETAEMED